MKKISRLLMMMLVLTVSAGLTNCDELFEEIDNPSPFVPAPEPTPEPTPTPEPAPEPSADELEAQRVAEARQLLQEAHEEGSVISFTYTVDGVEKTAVFQRVGNLFVLQSPSATRSGGADEDELTPIYLDYDGDENLDEDDDEDDDPDGEPQADFENLDEYDGDDDGDDDDDDNDGQSFNPDDVDWDPDEEGWADGYEEPDDTDDGGYDVDENDDDDDDGDEDDQSAGIRAPWSRAGISENSQIPSYGLVCFRAKDYSDHAQIILNNQVATFSLIQAVPDTYKTRGDGEMNYKTIGFSGDIVVNGKRFTMLNKDEIDESVSATRTRSSKTVKGKGGKKSIKITKIIWKKKIKELKGGKKYTYQAQVLPKNAKVKEIIWTSTNKAPVTSASVNKNNRTTCKITARFAGSIKLTCTAKGKNKKTKRLKKIKVTGQPANLIVVPKILSLTVDQQVQLEATVTGIAPGEKEGVTWVSSDNKIATVDKDGYVKAKSLGEAKITCKTMGKGTNGKIRVVECIVNVTAAPENTVGQPGGYVNSGDPTSN